MKTCLITLVVLLTPFVAVRADDSRNSSVTLAGIEQTVAPSTNSQDPAEAEDSAQLVQEVFQTELVYPQEKGEVQITTAAVWHEEQDGRLMRVPLVIEYGFTDDWQVEIELNPVQDREGGDGESANGIGDLELGTKYSFMNIGGSTFHAAVGLDVVVPVGDPDQDLGEGLLEFEPYVALGRDFPELNNAHLFGQVGLALVRRSRGTDSGEEEGPAAHELSVNTGFLVPVQNLRFVAELNWSTNRWNHEGDEASLFLTPGVVWDLPGTWEVGVGVPIGLMDNEDRFRVIGQLTWEFGGDDH